MRFKIIILIIVSLVFSACSKNEEQTTGKPNTAVNPDQHKAIVMEVIQVTDYTYLHVTENGKDYWIAAPKADFKVGEVILYSKSMEMKNFESKELKKTFDSILFIDNASVKLGEGIMNEPMKPSISKEEVNVEPVSGGVTLAQIFADPNKYANRTVKVKGKVVKINSGIMKRNWIHFQDGTNYQDDFDLTITTNDNVKNGDVVIFEGKIVLNKDFGYGYSYKVMMENAKASKNM
ncbi:MAG: SH3-like domain-containing protein [Melioribacter sp.]|nr:SH3-like domain-containing protein [Melioribacter sp.]